MPLTFYYGSGSPFAWKVWLALEHKHLAYDLRLLSFDQGDVRKPAFLAVNPRGKVPAIVDDGFALWESSAIVEYLEERYPERPLLPEGARERAITRRVMFEAESYLYPCIRRLVANTLFLPAGDGDRRAIDEAREGLARESERLESALATDYLAGPLSLADFTVYPFLALARRVGEKQPVHGVQLGPRLTRWMSRIESLPYFEATIPPHWRALASRLVGNPWRAGLGGGRLVEHRLAPRARYARRTLRRDDESETACACGR